MIAFAQRCRPSLLARLFGLSLDAPVALNTLHPMNAKPDHVPVLCQVAGSIGLWAAGCTGRTSKATPTTLRRPGGSKSSPHVASRHAAGAVLLLALFFVSASSYGISTLDYCVQPSAVARISPPQIVLSWIVDTNATNYSLYRKTRDTTNWGTATLLGTNSGYVDTNVTLGSVYEYKIVKGAMEVTTNWNTRYVAEGYILAGVEAPLVENRGKVLLLVDSSITNALASEIARLQLDLTGEGWRVVRSDVLRSTTPLAIKSIVTNEYYAEPGALKALFLLGHVPVPYSGLQNPDGHTDHYGAWPADEYYGDVDGLWTDTTVNDSTAGRPENRNVPGDGKFDQRTAPTDLELQVGRVDMSNMPSFPLSEVELLRQYLNRDHDFRFGYINPRRRALVDDEMGTQSIVAAAYRSFTPMFSRTNVFTGKWFSTLASNSYLSGLATGYGSYTSESGVGTTTSFVRTNTQVIFTSHFGSYFGDYDSQNNLMRAQLANAGGGLTCVWGGTDWSWHHMALGETVGFSALMTENFAGPVYKGYLSVVNNLLGDPTLRLHVVAPPSALKVTGVSGARDLRWRASPDSVLGYHVYGATSSSGPFTRLSTTLLTSTNFTDASAGTSVYMVRAVKQEISASGTYSNLSQGIFEDVTGTLSPPAITLLQPTNGSYFPLSVAIPLSVNTADANNDLLRVDYLTNGVLLGSTTNWPYPFTWSNAWIGNYQVSAVARDAAGLSTTSSVANITVVYATTSLVPTGSVWKYNDVGADLGTAWRAPDYDDSTWPSGPAQLGFGDGDERTLIVSNRLRVTTYFRKTFVATNGSGLGLTARLLRDDGGVVYLNGTEVFRSNMPTNQTILWDTSASATALTQDESTQYYATPVSLSLLRPGTNVLAAEIHQYGTNSSDLSFDFELLSTNLPAALNTAPVISALANAITDEDFPSAAIPFTIGDKECAVEWLSLSATCSNPNLVTPAGFMFGGTGSNRWLVVLPATNQNGSGTITVTVGDGQLTASTNFTLTVNAIPDPPFITWSNVSNGSLLSPGTISLAVNAADPDGNLASVQYFVDGASIGQSTAAPYGFAWTNVSPGYHRLEARAWDSTGLSSAASNLFVTVLGTPSTIVNPGTIWKYWDRGQQPSGSWTAPGYDDSAWPAGPSPLGYGDADGTWPATTNSYGTNANDRYITTYYRSAFVVSNLATLTNFIIQVQRDDGLLLYLNGSEVMRLNLPSGAVSYGTLATATVSTTDEVAWYPSVDKTAWLVPGTNVFAAEVHQVTNTSSDIFFNLKMTAQPILQPPTLGISSTPGQVQFSWPAWSAGLSLWSATNVGAEALWSPVTNGFVLTNGQAKITLPNGANEMRFYRLHGN